LGIQVKRCGHLGVAQQSLNCLYVLAPVNQKRRKAMAEVVESEPLPRREDNPGLDCRWHQPSRRILIPIRYSRSRRRRRVIFVHGRKVLALREMLESGVTRARRDRSPCTLQIHSLHRSTRNDEGWLIFDFTVRGFTICGCRWQPSTRSIQLPVTYGIDQDGQPITKKRVVCAYGAHINRLRRTLEDYAYGPSDQAQGQELESALIDA
jgi:hypothetical protein